MANEEHLARLKQGVKAWDRWREAHPNIQPDLSGMDLRGVDLRGANLRGANLYPVGLHWADLYKTDLQGANLQGADLYGANLQEARLYKANLRGADLATAYLYGADLRWANLRGASLIAALLVKTNFEGANLSHCWVYGTSTWNVNLTEADQTDLIITPLDEPEITVDSLEVAQFIYLLLRNEKIRDVIDTITSKAVLILGRFTPERKVVLDAIREEIRRQGLVPIMFDFTPSTGQTTLETISTLAHMARFVIADLTDAKSVLQELQAIVPLNPSVPVQPILLAAQEEPGMFDFFRLYPWVLETYRYHSVEEVLIALEEIIVGAGKVKERSGTVSREQQ